MKAKQTSRTYASIVNLFFNYANASFAIINGLVLVPLYLTYFPVGTYGSYLSSGNIVSMLGLLEGGMAFVLTQKLASSYAKKDIDGFSKTLGSGLFISVSIVFVLFIIGLAIFPFISQWVKAEPNQYKNIQYAFLYSAIGAGLNIMFHNISAVFQAMLKVSLSGYINLISIFFGITMTLLGLHFGLGVVAIPIGILVRGFVGVSILIFALIRILKREKLMKIQITQLDCSKLIKSVLPMFGGGVAKSLVSNSQLLIITNFISPTSSAVFFITGRIYQVCDSFLAPVGSSIFSSISQIVGEGNKDVLKKNIINIFFIFNAFSLSILSLSFIVNSSFVSLLLGADKYGGNMLSLLLCVNMLFYTRFNFLSVNLYALGLFGKTIFYDVIGSILRLIIIFLLIQYIGYFALPIAELFATILISGFYLNKLIVSKLCLNRKEAVKFIFSGLNFFVILSIFNTFWIIFFPNPHNLQSFILNASLIGMINFLIILFVSSDFKELFFGFITKLNNRSNV